MDQRIINRRYRIDRLLGEGGMAEVYLGHDILLHRPIAIKTLRSQFARDPGFRARFEREAQAAASFSHPNIIDIYDVGEDDGTPYIVMEYIPGENLARIIDAEGPFDADDVAVLIEQVASALDYAHDRGFVHRDIKPQNILVDEAGLAKVVDFGIAKGLADSDLTATGAGLGTVHYVSPEQASGLMATPSSDIYSLGIVAYEMLTGRLPFEADTPVGIAMKHVNELPPHPLTLNPGLAQPVVDIVLHALEKDPTARYRNAGAFADALTNWRSAADTRAIPQPSEAAPAGRAGGAAPYTHPQPALASSGAPPTVTTQPAGRVPLAGHSAAAPAVRADRTGCAGWIAAFAVIAALGALIWFGFQMAPGLPGAGDDDPTTTPGSDLGLSTAAAEEEVEQSEPTPPAIVPRDDEEDEPEPASVPDIEGMTLDEAESAADESELIVEQVGTEASDDVDEGRILRQDPAPETEVEPGSTISIVVSSGSSEIDLAEMQLFGIPADEAEDLLRERGLEVRRQDQSSSEVQEGGVIGTEPSDVAAPGETVTLFVSVGDKVQIPSEIQGAPVDEATGTLEDLGFSVAETIPVSREYIEQFDIDLEAAGFEDQDVVGIQDNDAGFGAWLPPGTSVTLVYYDQQLDEQQEGQ